MFRTVFPSIIRTYRLYIQRQAYVRYCRLLASGKEMELLMIEGKTVRNMWSVTPIK